MPYEQVEKDAYEFVPFLNDINPAEPFRESDAESALECYDHRYCTFPLKDIEVISAISIERNRRNGRNQKTHLKIARMIQQLNDEENGTNWREGNGRPIGSGTREQVVREYMADHPGMSVSEIAKVLKISRTTVYKYKDKEPVKREEQTKIDYLVELSDGTKVMIKSMKPLSEYDQQRLARLKVYQERMEKLANTALEKDE